MQAFKGGNRLLGRGTKLRQGFYSVIGKLLEVTVAFIEYANVCVNHGEVRNSVGAERFNYVFDHEFILIINHWKDTPHGRLRIDGEERTRYAPPNRR